MFEIPVRFERITNENDGKRENSGDIGFFGPRNNNGTDHEQQFGSMRSSELESHVKAFNSTEIVTLGQTQELGRDDSK